jgi:hypothetical protein
MTQRWLLGRLRQKCTNPGRWVTQTTRFCTVAPNIVGPLYFTCFVSPFWHLDFQSASYVFGKFVYYWPEYQLDDTTGKRTPHSNRNYATSLPLLTGPLPGRVQRRQAFISRRRSSSRLIHVLTWRDQNH